MHGQECTMLWCRDSCQQKHWQGLQASAVTKICPTTASINLAWWEFIIDFISLRRLLYPLLYILSYKRFSTVICFFSEYLPCPCFIYQFSHFFMSFFIMNIYEVSSFLRSLVGSFRFVLIRFLSFFLCQFGAFSSFLLSLPHFSLILNVYINTYIWIERERERQTDRQTDRQTEGWSKDERKREV